jgi:hypothetical protein
MMFVRGARSRLGSNHLRGGQARNLSAPSQGSLVSSSRSISHVGLAPVWFSSCIRFVKEGGVSGTVTYLSGRVVVLIELLAGSSVRPGSRSRCPR